MSTNQLLYQPLPKSAVLTREQVADFDHLEKSLESMKDWLEANHYQGTVLEPVTISQSRDIHGKLILNEEMQRIYPLPVTIHTSLGAFTPPKWFAVNTDGGLLSRSNILDVSTSVQHDWTYWISARLTGVKPIYAGDIAASIDKLVSR